MPTKKEFTYEHNLDDIYKELLLAEKSKPATKDILIVVYNQLDYVKTCFDSIAEHTTAPFNVWVWDNGSDEETVDYLTSYDKMSVHYFRSDENTGFIKPNNELAKKGNGDYIILLNSDVEVRKNWDKTMIGWLQANPDFGEVGYLGGWLDEEGKGKRFGFGCDVDYICGWSLCVKRDFYNQIGLFDEHNLEFAYCEDSDLSFRTKEAGKKIYALHSDLIVHYENKTVNQVRKEGTDILTSFNKNHAYIKSRWRKCLSP